MNCGNFSTKKVGEIISKIQISKHMMDKVVQDHGATVYQQCQPFLWLVPLYPIYDQSNIGTAPNVVAD